MADMSVQKLNLGMIGTNVYFLINKASKETLIVDPADEADRIAAFCRKNGFIPQAILLTHGHADHMYAADALKDLLGVKLYALDKEAALLSDPTINCSLSLGRAATASPDEFFTNLETREMAGFRMQVLGTPGHTAGSCCYYFAEQKVLISGDTLFNESFGRTDLPTGDMNALITSLRMLLSSLPADTAVYPGHMGETTIGSEKKFYMLA